MGVGSEPTRPGAYIQCGEEYVVRLVVFWFIRVSSLLSSVQEAAVEAGEEGVGIYWKI